LSGDASFPVFFHAFFSLLLFLLFLQY
jgi:hypothetical protein